MTFLTSKSVFTLQLLVVILLVPSVSTADPSDVMCQLLRNETARQLTASGSELYSISMSVNCYTPSQQITVNLTSAGNAIFDAFTMRAVRTDNNNKTGTFSTSDSSTRLLSCSGLENDTIASIEQLFNANHSTFHWTAGSALNDVTAVTFRAVFMRNISGNASYWVVNKTLPNCEQTSVRPIVLASAESSINSVLSEVTTTFNNSSNNNNNPIATTTTATESRNNSVAQVTADGGFANASIGIPTATNTAQNLPSSSTREPPAPVASSTLAAAAASNSSTPSPTAESPGGQSPSTATVQLPDSITTKTIDVQSTVTTTSPLVTVSSVTKVTLPSATTARRAEPEVTSAVVNTRPGSYSAAIANATAVTVQQMTVTASPVINGGIYAQQRFKLHELHALIVVCSFILRSVFKLF